MYEDVFKCFVFHGDVHPRGTLALNLETNSTGVPHEDTIASIRQIERDVLVGKLRGGAAVFIPDVHSLAVLDERAEALAQAIDKLPNTKIEICRYEAAVAAVEAFAVGAVSHVSHVPEGARAMSGQSLTSGVQEIESELILLDVQSGRQVAAAHSHMLLLPFDMLLARAISPERKVRSDLDVAGPVGGFDADHIFSKSVYMDGDGRAVEGVTSAS